MLPDSIKAIYLNPEKFKGEPQLCYPPANPQNFKYLIKAKLSEIVNFKINSPVRTHKAASSS